MKPTLLSAFFVALTVVGAACASQSGGSTGTGGASGSGGTSSAGGSTSSGGAQGTGGTQGTGGAPGEGGKQGTGGAESTGGKQGTGGARATGGAQGTGGSAGTGGVSAGDAGRDVPAKDDAPAADTAVPKDGQGSASDGGVIRARQINTRGFTFDVLETGSAGEPVLLLHGFPDTSLEWTALMPVLSAAGYHCLAPDQRGYSPGARPTEVDAYKYEELVADAFAIGSELGERFHVIGHDWGTNVGWLMLEKDPSRIASFTAISIPHYQVWARSVYDDPAMAGYLSMLNTWMTEGTGEAYLDSGTDEEHVDSETSRPERCNHRAHDGAGRHDSGTELVPGVARPQTRFRGIRGLDGECSHAAHPRQHGPGRTVVDRH